MTPFAIGAGGVRLRCVVSGPSDGPTIVFVHGWSQSLEAWDPVFDSEVARRFRLVAYDLRGHGFSGAPVGRENYTDGRLWADDLAVVIDHCGLAGQPVVLVGWSYGGLVIGDYLRHHGAERVAGIVYVGASINLDDAQVPEYLNPAFVALAEQCSSTEPEEAEAAIRSFVQMCSAEPLPTDLFEQIVAANLLTRPDVRAALGARTVHSDDLLATLSRPVLVIQGAADSIVLPATARYIESVCPTAKVVEYEAVGHLPMHEAADRFRRDLAAFVDGLPPVTAPT